MEVGNYIQYADNLTLGMEYDMDKFTQNWIKNNFRYCNVCEEVNLPAPLIAAIHWRECGGDTKPDMWGRYLHQGDPLGYPCKHEPRYPEVPIFGVDQWEDAAVHALRMKKGIQEKLGITADTDDLNVLCEYAQAMNGYGYKRMGLNSPYVLSGTTGYSKGKYVSDGNYDANAVDLQLGVLPMLRATI